MHILLQYAVVYKKYFFTYHAAFLCRVNIFCSCLVLLVFLFKILSFLEAPFGSAPERILKLQGSSYG